MTNIANTDHYEEAFETGSYTIDLNGYFIAVSSTLTNVTATNGIVIGTDNYTEYLLGFSTIGGDALFDYNPIQFLWKTEVFGISKAYQIDYTYDDVTKAAAIKESLALKPMDGLGISVDDMVQIGARNYYDVDDILKWYLNTDGKEKYPKNIVSSRDGHLISRDTIERVVSRHKNSEFKRNHPIVIKREEYM